MQPSAEQPSAITQVLRRAKAWTAAKLLQWSHAQTSDVIEVGHYEVVFTGRYLLPEDQAAANVAAFFKLGRETTMRMLQERRAFKRYADKAPADKLVRLLKQAGIECRVVLQQDEDALPEAGRWQKLAMAIDAAQVPDIVLPDPRQFGRRQWLITGAALSPAVIALLWSLVSPPVVHGKDMASYADSIDRMADRLDGPQMGPFYHAVQIATEASRAAQASSTAEEAVKARLIYAPIAGKTAQQVIALAEQKLARQRESYQQGIAEADRKLADVEAGLRAVAEANAAVVSRITIENPRYTWFTGAAPSLTFSLRNGSMETLTKFYLQGYLYTGDGRLLLSAPLSYSVPTGLLPGKMTQVLVPATVDGPWALPAAKGQSGLRLEVRVANAEDHAGKLMGQDYRPLENERKRQLEWKQRVEARMALIRL